MTTGGSRQEPGPTMAVLGPPPMLDPSPAAPRSSRTARTGLALLCTSLLLAGTVVAWAGGWHGVHLATPKACDEPAPRTDQRPPSIPSSPRLVGCRMVVLDGDEIVGLHVDDLSVGWRLPCRWASWASILPSTHPGIEVVSCNGRFAAFVGASGDVLWSQREVPFNRLRVGPSVLVAQEDGQGVVVVDLAGGHTLFEIDEPLPANVATDAARVYTSTNLAVTAYDIDSGDVAWRITQPSSGLLATGDGVFARTNEHKVLRLDPATGEIVASSGVRRPTELGWSEFGQASDAVVVLTQVEEPYTVSAYDAVTLERLWLVESSWGRRVAVGDGVVAIGDADSGETTVYDERSGEPLSVFEGVIPDRPEVADGHLFLIGVDADGSIGVRREHSR